MGNEFLVGTPPCARAMNRGATTRVSSRGSKMRMCMLASVATAIASLMSPLVHALNVTWVPNETRVSAQPDMIDYEFSQSRGMLAWSDETGHLWIANVDRNTGDFIPADGKGLMIDPDVMTFQDAQKTKNGPEWVSSAFGDAIVYTKYNGKHADGNSRIGYAFQAPNGAWSAGLLGPNFVRKAPYGSATDGDLAPRITYVDSLENHYWRELLNADTEKSIADFPASNYPIRHVRGARAVAYPRTVNGVDQVFYRDFDTNVVEQLTFDAGTKYEVWMWKAPEFNGEFVFMTLVDQVEARIYRKLPTGENGAMRWTPIYSKTAPAGNQMFSPEPFVWNGRSYFFMAMSVKPNKFRSEIWISNIDAASPVFKRITDNTELRTRTDPEVFVTSSGPLIYYNRLIPDESGRKPKSCRNPQCSDGVYRADPGL